MGLNSAFRIISGGASESITRPLGELARSRGYEDDPEKWGKEVWEGKLGGIVSGYQTTGTWEGAVVGSAIGTVGGLEQQKTREGRERQEESARRSRRGALTAKQAIAGLQAARARRQIIQRAAISRAQSVSRAEAAGAVGSGREGAISSIASQLQGELSYEDIAQQLSKRAGTFSEQATAFENRATRARERQVETAAYTGLAFQAFSTFYSPGKKKDTDSTTEQEFDSGSVTSQPSVFNT